MPPPLPTRVYIYLNEQQENRTNGQWLDLGVDDCLFQFARQVLKTDPLFVRVHH